MKCSYHKNIFLRKWNHTVRKWRWLLCSRSPSLLMAHITLITLTMVSSFTKQELNTTWPMVFIFVSSCVNSYFKLNCMWIPNNQKNHENWLCHAPSDPAHSVTHCSRRGGFVRLCPESPTKPSSTWSLSFLQVPIF